ncbi:MAG: hypothetical protein LRZ85_01980 [Alphaproteobacteria bacterium]|nr:hypothetical protein [Alphaproteobacteria bacterium]MCD8525731.1 hypothetical protein [Alphaproteobacteria bacterium]MCD8570995.1 hypothetical protein [Alphaproteobacteria bacterium]
MNIDLLFTRSGAAGLIASSNWIKKVAGVLLDTQSGIVTIEYADTDFLELNIPIEAEYFPILDFNQSIHLGAVVNGHIAQAYQVPLVFADDPYRNQTLAPHQDENPLSAFSYFVKSCVAGQPVHREDLGNENTMGCILGDSSPSSLEFAPHLARRHAFEMKPQLDLSHLPTLGLGSGGGGGGAVRRTDDSKGKKK